MLRAFRTTFIGVDSIVPARSVAHARAITQKCAQNVGWNNVAWKEIKVIRWPYCDEWAKKAKQICWNPEVVPHCYYCLDTMKEEERPINATWCARTVIE